MKLPDVRSLLALVCLLLALNLGTSLLPSPAGPFLPAARGDVPSDGLLPRGRAEYQNATIVTSSEDGAVLYVWNTDVINGRVVAQGRFFTAAN